MRYFCADCVAFCLEWLVPQVGQGVPSLEEALRFRPISFEFIASYRRQKLLVCPSRSVETLAPAWPFVKLIDFVAIDLIFRHSPATSHISHHDVPMLFVVLK